MASLLALTFLLALSTVSCAPAPAPLTYAALDPFKLQWNVTFALTTTPDKTKFIPHVGCTSKNLGEACNKVAMSPDNKDRIQINITLKNLTSVSNFKTLAGLPPSKVAVKLCYSETSSMDRPWRKANKVIKKDKACPITVKTVDWKNATFNNHTFVYNFSMKTDLAKAVWYVRVIVKCNDGTVDGKWCQYDGTKLQNYFETTTIEQVTPALRTAIIIMSIAGPAFMIAYMVIDHIRRKNK